LSWIDAPPIWACTWPLVPSRRRPRRSRFMPTITHLASTVRASGIKPRFRAHPSLCAQRAGHRNPTELSTPPTCGRFDGTRRRAPRPPPSQFHPIFSALHRSPFSYSVQPFDRCAPGAPTRGPSLRELARSMDTPSPDGPRQAVRSMTSSGSSRRRMTRGADIYPRRKPMHGAGAPSASILPAGVRRPRIGLLVEHAGKCAWLPCCRSNRIRSNPHFAHARPIRRAHMEPRTSMPLLAAGGGRGQLPFRPPARAPRPWYAREPRAARSSPEPPQNEELVRNAACPTSRSCHIFKDAGDHGGTPTTSTASLGSTTLLHGRTPPSDVEQIIRQNRQNSTTLGPPQSIYNRSGRVSSNATPHFTEGFPNFERPPPPPPGQRSSAAVHPAQVRRGVKRVSATIRRRQRSGIPSLRVSRRDGGRRPGRVCAGDCHCVARHATILANPSHVALARRLPKQPTHRNGGKEELRDADA
jgi:hypothetical protein